MEPKQLPKEVPVADPQMVGRNDSLGKTRAFRQPVGKLPEFGFTERAPLTSAPMYSCRTHAFTFS